jgi:beta-barrel assembly-enhancing protease
MKARYPFFLSFLLVLSLLGGFVKGGQAMTTEEEIKLGKKAMEEIGKQLDVVRDLSLQVFVNRVGQSLANQVGPTPFQFNFYVFKAPDPNAFAIPGGYIFVTTGLLSLAENEPELAGVLGHEISHITGRHMARMMEKSKPLSILTLAAVIAGAIAGGGGKASQAAVAVGMASAESMMLKYTREIEAEADQNSLHLMTKTGYDPQAMVSFLKKMERYSLSNVPKYPSHLMDHPTLESRVSLLENLLLIEAKPPHPFPGMSHYRRIQMRASIEEGEPSTSINHFESLVKANPEDLDALFGLGLAFQKAGRLDKSIEVFQSASRVDSKDADLLRELGVDYFLAGRLDQSVQTLEPQSRNDDLKSVYFLGRAYQEKGDFERALKLFLRVKGEAENYIDLYSNLGSVYGRLGEKGLSHFSYGRYFELRGDKSNALLHYRTALRFLEGGGPERGEAQRIIQELTEKK